MKPLTITFARRVVPLLTIALFLAMLGAAEDTVFHALGRHWRELAGLYQAYPLPFTLLFWATHAVIIGALIPASIVMMLLAGAIFGPVSGTFVAAAGNAAGAAINFMAARGLLYRRVQGRYRRELAEVNANVRRDGWFYLLLMRAVPMLPSTLVSLLMGITPMPLSVFLAVSFIGTMPLTALYVFVGTRLPEIGSARDALSSDLVAALVVLVCLLAAGKWIAERRQRS